MEKIRNKNLLKRGGYSVALIAIVIAGAIILNLLVGLLATRVNLEYDLTAEKKNSISKENREYLEGVKKPVDVYIIASSGDEYAGGYMEYYANSWGYSAQTSEYYKQTIRLLETYDEINDNITVTYLDPYGVEMSKISTEYPESYAYGDILVVSEFESQGGLELKNHKRLGFVDIYNYSDLSGSASYGYDYYYVSGSRLETSLTSAIASVTSEESKKIAFLSGHGGSDTYGYYKKLLELNNFTVDEIDDTVLTSISEEYDAVVISAPVTDFAGSELDLLNDYLDNGGKKGKTLLYFGDSGYQNLPNLNDFLAEWGIQVQEGIVFETSPELHLDKQFSTFISFAANADNKIVTSNQVFLTGYNIPMKENGEPFGGRETTTLAASNATCVVAPIGTSADWEPTEEYERDQFSTIILCEEADFLDGKAVSSYVLAFSSIDFISEEYAMQYGGQIDYTGLALKALQVPTGMNAIEISFEDKTIISTDSKYITSQSSAKFVLIFFVAVIPLGLLGFATFIFIRRRNL